jgi:hypothetical protein
MPTVYLETTIPSYLAAYPSRDLIMAAHQQSTHEWWREARQRFEVDISAAVLADIRAGDPDAAARRLAIVEGLPILALHEDVRALVHAYDQRLRLGERARADLPHVAFAVAYAMDYLVTWNGAHLANGEVIRWLREVNVELQHPTPIIVTPEELLESPEEEGV